MKKIRVISRIDIKNEYVVKGIQLEGLRKIGNPNELAKKYYEEGIDEIIFMDAVAAYYDRNSLSHIIEKACEDVFVPITVGGGIRKIEDIKKALQSGADKVAINTQAVKEPDFIKKSSKVFGSQCIVASIVAKKIEDNKWESYIDNGREPTGLDVVEWAKKLQDLGAGELMVTSLDREGTKKGFDIELYSKLSDVINIPFIASGGMKDSKDVIKLILNSEIDAFTTASSLHYKLDNIPNIKKNLQKNGFEVRI